MKLTVLGCHGGESAEHRATTFLIDDNIALDAGALCRSTSLEMQLKIDHVVLSHSHLDHICDLAFMTDNMIGLRHKPIKIHCSEETSHALKNHFFNNVIWPDFSHIKIPGSELPVIEYEVFYPNRSFHIGQYQFKTFIMNHPVESLAMMIEFPSKNKGFAAIGYSSDTGLTDNFWKEFSHTPHLQAILCECSFSHEYQWLADLSGHLSPQSLSQILKKINLPQHIPILLYHFKPTHVEKLRQELLDLKDSRLRMLNIGDVFEFS